MKRRLIVIFSVAAVLIAALIIVLVLNNRTENRQDTVYGSTSGEMIETQTTAEHVTDESVVNTTADAGEGSESVSENETYPDNEIDTLEPVSDEPVTEDDDYSETDDDYSPMIDDYVVEYEGDEDFEIID